MHSSPTVAVVGAATPIGRAVVEVCARDGNPLVAVDVFPPPFASGKVLVRLMDARDRLLPLALDGVQTVVHAAFNDDLTASADTLYGHNVGGTRNVLDAVSKIGASHLVVISSTGVFGAHADNDVPLADDAPSRANPAVAWAHQRGLVETMVREWASAHPAVTVTILRVAPLLLDGSPSLAASLLGAPRLPVPAGTEPLWQFAHSVDVAAAVQTVLAGRHPGSFNVACDGWLTSVEVADLMGRRTVEVGRSSMEAVLSAGQWLGISPAPPGHLPFLIHPLVVDTAGLKALGWQPTFANRDVVTMHRELTANQIAIGTLRVSRTLLRRISAGTASLLGLAAWRLIRR